MYANIRCILVMQTTEALVTEFNKIADIWTPHYLYRPEALFKDSFQNHKLTAIVSFFN